MQSDFTCCHAEKIKPLLLFYVIYRALLIIKILIIKQLFVLLRNKIKNTKDMMQIKYKTIGRIGLFDRDETSSKLSKSGNPLEKLHNVIDFEMFRFEI